MARPRSEDRREAILAAAIRVIADQGLSAPTALIAKGAGVSNGSLFTYFATKAELLNDVYVGLKEEMAAAAQSRLPIDGTPREQMLHLWSNWLRWASSCPEKRRTLAHLGVSGEISAESHQQAAAAMGSIAALVERSREHGPMAKESLGFVCSLMNAMAETTTDFMIQDRGNADRHATAGFEALWRMIA